MLAKALEYEARGWAVIPLADKRRPLVRWKQFASKRPSRDQIKQWWTEHPDAGVAVLLGSVSGVVRLDVDGNADLTGWPESLSFRTPSGGLGVLYSIPKKYDVITEVLWKGENHHEELRIQSDGAYTVVPPTPGWEWIGGELSEFPRDVLLDQMARRAAADMEKFQRSVSPTLVEPDRDMLLEAVTSLSADRADDYDSWIRVGIALHSAGDEYFEQWVQFSQKSDKFTPGECEKLWASFVRGGSLTARSVLYWAKQDGWRCPRLHEPLTDVGNGRVLARAAVGRAVFCRTWDKWLCWDGRRWVVGADLEVVAEAKKVVRERYERAAKSLMVARKRDEEEDSGGRRAKSISRVLSWCTLSESAKHIHAAVDMAKSEPGMSVDHAVLDRKPWYLNCPNGVVDLRSGELMDHDPAMMLTQMCPTEYWADAECPRWEKFLDEVFDGNTELVDWLQRLLGYCTTGVVREHVLPIFHGGGRNGKSTLVKTIIAVLGHDYAGTTPSGFVAQSRSEQHPAKLVELYGKRFAAELETSDGTRLNEELVKRLTGGDQISARRLYENFWKFDPTHKLVVATNYEPTVRGSDSAIWARIRLVPFSVSFEGREDFSLEEKLVSESCGILRWLVDGCVEWDRRGIGECGAVRGATAAYRAEQDTVSAFLEEKYGRSADGRVRKSEVLQQYRTWCYMNKHVALTGKAFSTAAMKLGVMSDETGKFYMGLIPL